MHRGGINKQESGGCQVILPALLKAFLAYAVNISSVSKPRLAYFLGHGHAWSSNNVLYSLVIGIGTTPFGPIHLS